eukprot:252304-Rhodomonas_salina.1
MVPRSVLHCLTRYCLTRYCLTRYCFPPSYSCCTGRAVCTGGVVLALVLVLVLVSSGYATFCTGSAVYTDAAHDLYGRC